jgi:hypothetical protein
MSILSFSLLIKRFMEGMYDNGGTPDRLADRKITKYFSW